MRAHDTPRLLSDRPAHVRGAAVEEYRGFCRACGREHRLRVEPSPGLAALEALFASLETDAAVAAERAALEASPGKMIGVLITRGGDILRAYSGELGGRRDWPRWVAPVLRRADTAEIEAATLETIARLDARIAAIDVPAAQRRLDEYRVAFRKQPNRIEEAKTFLLSQRATLSELRKERRRASQRLSTAMFNAAAVTNARGERRPLRDIFVGDRISGGTTDCCVPKLLEAANVAGLRPLSVAEAWWGPTTNGRRHGELQPPCERKCLPILGHLLCGLAGRPTGSSRSGRA